MSIRNRHLINTTEIKLVDLHPEKGDMFLMGVKLPPLYSWKLIPFIYMHKVRDGKVHGITWDEDGYESIVLSKWDVATVLARFKDTDEG